MKVSRRHRASTVLALIVAAVVVLGCTAPSGGASGAPEPSDAPAPAASAAPAAPPDEYGY